MNLIFPLNLTNLHYRRISLLCIHVQNSLIKNLVEQWIELINTLINKGENIVLISGKSKKEIKLADFIHRRFAYRVKNYAGAFDIEQIPLILKKTKLFIGLDSSISHLSALLGLKTVVIFGPTNPKNWIPVPINYQLNNSLDLTP